MTVDRKLLAVGLGELQVAKEPEAATLAIFGLGSCIGVALYDPALKLGGLVHIVLPTAPADCTIPAKFADTAVPLLVREMVHRGAIRSRLVVKLAGGANVLSLSSPQRELLNIGERNLAAVEQALAKEHLRATAQATGGHQGRTIRFLLATGQMLINSFGQAEKIL